MLVLTRKNRESVVVLKNEAGEPMLKITVLEIEGGRVKLGFEAEQRLPIHRQEIYERILRDRVALSN
jgi:carbon storage regulator CsrA